jgi:hypothetical protein
MDFKRYRGKLNSVDQPFFPADSNCLVAWEWLCSWGLIYESRPEIFWFSTAAQPMTSSIFQRLF